MESFEKSLRENIIETEYIIKKKQLEILDLVVSQQSLANQAPANTFLKKLKIKEKVCALEIENLDLDLQTMKETLEKIIYKKNRNAETPKEPHGQGT